jgi:hypothetical protein
VGQGTRHSRGPRTGLGRRLAGRLGADHHRPGSPALRPAVRAVPEPRAGLHARLRHRLLPGAAGRGDRLRAGEVRPRPRGPDHHLRLPAGPRRAARRRPGDAAAAGPGRPALQDGAQQPGRAGDPGPGHRHRAAPQAGPRRGRQRQGLPGRGPAAGRPVPQRLDPRRRRGDRRPAPDPADPALQGSALGPAGHPVQHEVGRERRPGEVRLPGPEDPDRARPGGEAPGQARRDHRPGQAAASTTPRPTS